MLLGFLSRIAGMVVAAGLLDFGLHGYLALAGRVTPNASLLVGCAMAVIIGGLVWRGIERRIAALDELAASKFQHRCFVNRLGIECPIECLQCGRCWQLAR